MTDDLVVAIDAMGNDLGPQVIIDGLEIARSRNTRIGFLLFGDEEQLRPLLCEKSNLSACTVLYHTEDVVKMGDKPSSALRRARNSSMWKAIAAVKKGEAKAVISGGNTGALMAISAGQLKFLSCIERPAIAIIWPTLRAESVVLDVGANLEANDRELVDFAILGAEFARAVLGIKHPIVGLLNIGSEKRKGRASIQKAAQILQNAPELPLCFYGFVEGDDIGKGIVDVVVSDGFTGNIAIKTAEGTARQVAKYMRAMFPTQPDGKIGLSAGQWRITGLKDKN